MDRDDFIATVSRLEAVAERFEKTADKVDKHEERIGSLEQSRATWRTFGKFAAGVVAPLIVGVLLFFLVGRGKP